MNYKEKKALGANQVLFFALILRGPFFFIFGYAK
jgi:hypothetical protein